MGWSNEIPNPFIVGGAGISGRIIGLNEAGEEIFTLDEEGIYVLNPADGTHIWLNPQADEVGGSPDIRFTTTSTPDGTYAGIFAGNVIGPPVGTNLRMTSSLYTHTVSGEDAWQQINIRTDASILGVYTPADGYQGGGLQIRDNRLGLGMLNNNVFGNRVFIDNTQLSLISDEIRLITADTTASAANCHIDTATGRISRSTSSLRYKTDVHDFRPDPDTWFRMRPARFRSRAEVDRNGDRARWHIGLIAEDLDALGLTELVLYDKNGRPDAVQYERLAVGLLDLIRNLATQVRNLTDRVEELEL